MASMEDTLNTSTNYVVYQKIINKNAIFANPLSFSYINAFCGRTPKSVLARHYLDYSPEKMRKICEKADLKVLT